MTQEPIPDDLRTAITLSAKARRQPTSIARWFRVPLTTVRAVLDQDAPPHRGRTAVTEEQRAEVIQMAKDYKTGADIAAKTGVLEGTVATIISTARRQGVDIPYKVPVAAALPAPASEPTVFEVYDQNNTVVDVRATTALEALIARDNELAGRPIWDGRSARRAKRTYQDKETGYWWVRLGDLRCRW